jgi:hypothetical protein
METSKVSSLVAEALKKDTTTQNVQVAGIGTTRAGYFIRLRDKEAKWIACKNEQWLKELGKGVKIAKPRFGELYTAPQRMKSALLEDNISTDYTNRVERAGSRKHPPFHIPPRLLAALCLVT